MRGPIQLAPRRPRATAGGTPRADEQSRGKEEDRERTGDGESSPLLPYFSLFSLCVPGSFRPGLPLPVLIFNVWVWVCVYVDASVRACPVFWQRPAFNEKLDLLLPQSIPILPTFRTSLEVHCAFFLLPDAVLKSSSPSCRYCPSCFHPLSTPAQFPPCRGV